MVPLPLEILPPLERTTLGAPPWQSVSPLPAVALPDRCDIVIVGAGLTGLSAALRSAAAGRQVVVLERRFGGGATARSGGIVIGDTAEGPDARFARCDDTLRAWIEQSAADCDWRWQGCLELARNWRLSASPIDWQDEGVVRLAGRVSGGVLDPARLLVSLYRAAVAAGAAVVDGVTVTNLTRDGGRIEVTTDHGTITANAGIMGVDAISWRRGFDPWRERVITVSMQTVPVSSDALAALGLGADEAFYTVDMPLLWGRVMPDRSLLVGRETQPFPSHPGAQGLGNGLAEAGTRLLRRIRGLHPTLTTIERQRLWAGPLARTAAGHPIIAEDPFVPSLVWAGGYGGQGIAQAFTLGARAAEEVMGKT
jgi:gamma-glutamylputrescine oxidase